MTRSALNRLAARARWQKQIVSTCFCGHCPNCKARQSPEERLRLNLEETHGMRKSFTGSALKGIADEPQRAGRVDPHRAAM